MVVTKEEDRTIVKTDNVVIDIGRAKDGRVFIDVYPYDHKEASTWFLNDEKGNNVYWKSFLSKKEVSQLQDQVRAKDQLV